MKNAILITVILLVSLKGFGIGKYKEGQPLYVWAKSGLKFREKPDFKSEVVTNIPFGGEIGALELQDFYAYWRSTLKVKI